MMRRLAIRSLLLAIAGVILVSTTAQADDWPQWLGPERDGVWRENGILSKFPAGGPKIRWRAVAGQGYAGPAVAGNRVYVTDFVLNAGVDNPSNPFAQSRLAGKERVLCLNDADGKTVWKHKYDCTYRISYPAGPRCTPVVDGGKVYTLGAMGDLLCLNATTGTVLWSKNFPKDFQAPVPMWGFTGHPLIDGDKLICLVGGADSLVVAFHKDTGKELWRSLAGEHQGYCPPMIYAIQGRRQLIVWDPHEVHGLDPETGKPIWSQPFNVKADLTIPTPRFTGNLLLVSSFYNGSMMLKFEPGQDKPTIQWKAKTQSEQPRLTDGLHSLMCTPFIKDGYIYGVCSYGELRCLKADTGDRLWKTMKATSGGPEERWSNAFIVAQGDRYFLMNEKGDLIIATMTRQGYEEMSRAHIIDPTNRMVRGQRADGASVLWSHPAYAHRSVYVRNDKEIVCASLAADH